jgi:hypothetical protein
MRPLSALLATAALSFAILACGDAAKKASSRSSSTSTVTSTAPSSVTSTQRTVNNAPDRDHDDDHNNDDYAYGHRAGAVDTREVTRLLKRYYTAAVADNGKRGCSLIYSNLVKEIPYFYGNSPNYPALRGKTCAAVMSKVFRPHRRRLIVDLATLEVTELRVKGPEGLALLSFRGMPHRNILVYHEGNVWKINELLDMNLG